MTDLKDVAWLVSTKKESAGFSEQVVDDIGYNLFEAQEGKMPQDAKPLCGYGGAGVQEIVSGYDSDTYRAVYVLHCFQKKSKKGGELPRENKATIQARYKQAKQEHDEWQILTSKKK